MIKKILFIGLFFVSVYGYSQKILTLNYVNVNVIILGKLVREFKTKTTFIIDTDKREVTHEDEFGKGIYQMSSIYNFGKSPKLYISCTYQNLNEPDEDKRIMTMKEFFIIVDLQDKTLVFSKGSNNYDVYN